MDMAIAVVRAAFELGINYFDTAPLDGDSEVKIGIALEDVRAECVFATKTASRTKRDSLEEVQNSLKRLRTDHLDIIQLHGIDDEKTLAKALGEDGSLWTCKDAKKEGLTNFIGITGHRPRVLAKAIETGEFDTVLVPINVITRQALEELLPIAKAHNVGVVAMKPLSAKTSNLITCLYQPSLSLVSQEPELKTFLGETPDQQVTNALRYVLSQDVATVIPGQRSLHEVQVATNTGEEYHSLTLKEQQHFTFNLGDYCRDCSLCISCPEKINIPAILRFQGFSEIYSLKEWAKKLYGGLEVKADKCTGCGVCEGRCPYKLPVMEKLRKAQRDFR